MNGKICLITGATNGIGKEGARALARLGATVVLVGRSAEKGAAVVREIKESTGSDKVDLLLADLSSMADVRRLAEQFRARYTRLDVLVNNAGAIFYDRETTVDGYERTFALNHLSYFLLTNLLLDVLKASAPARIVNVSSDAHRFGAMNFDDLQNTRFSAFPAYGRSKLANVLFTYELARRLAGTGVTANAMHPGFVASGFGRTGRQTLIQRVFALMQRFALTPERGAQTLIYLASSPEVEGITGKYWAKQKATDSSKVSYDQSSWQRLWQESERLTGLTTAEARPLEAKG